jgi:phenylalanine-4-hydroxylase
MTIELKNAPQRSYRDIDHDTWRRLCAKQMDLVKDAAPEMYWDGFERLQLDLQRLPVQDVMSAHLNDLVGWQLSNAQDEYLKPVDWHSPARGY